MKKKLSHLSIICLLLITNRGGGIISATSIAGDGGVADGLGEACGACIG